MSTRSNIGIINKDGTVEVVYCHWDGYPSYNGVLLLNHYNSEERARDLISFGDISQLREKIRPETQHSFDNPQDGVTIFYKRDRDEVNVDARKYDTIDAYWKEEGYYFDIEYVYMWDAVSGKWKWSGESKSQNLKRLFKKDCKETK